MPDSPSAPPRNGPLTPLRSGKVRDLYRIPPDAGGPRLLLVASDRLSAFDVIMPTPFPGKGALLTEISNRWFDWIEANRLADHHRLTTRLDNLGLPDDIRRDFEGRATVGREVRIIPIECVARGYLAGSGWKEYRRSQTVCGIPLPAGLRLSDQLPEPIFTPATKAESGHDENISFEEVRRRIGGDLAERLRDLTLRLYARAADYARQRGIILADTKFEFGFALDAQGKATDRLLLADEALTPDSSRFWPADDYEPGREQKSFDKQFVRNYLETLVESGRWNKQAPGPEIPAEIVAATIEKYRSIRALLFG